MELKQVLGSGHVTMGVDWEGEQVKVTFDPNVLTPKLISMLQSTGEDRAAEQVVNMCDKLLVDWDITEGGEPFPPNPQNIESLPLRFLIAIVTGIAGEMKVGPLSSGTSDVPS